MSDGSNSADLELHTRELATPGFGRLFSGCNRWVNWEEKKNTWRAKTLTHHCTTGKRRLVKLTEDWHECEHVAHIADTHQYDRSASEISALTSCVVSIWFTQHFSSSTSSTSSLSPALYSLVSACLCQSVIIPRVSTPLIDPSSDPNADPICDLEALLSSLFLRAHHGKKNVALYEQNMWTKMSSGADCDHPRVQAWKQHHKRRSATNEICMLLDSHTGPFNQMACCSSMILKSILHNYGNRSQLSPSDRTLKTPTVLN